MSEVMREFKIFLPLYDGVKNIEIGIDSKSSIKNQQKIQKSPSYFMGRVLRKEGVHHDQEWHTQISFHDNWISMYIILVFNGNCRMEQPIAELISTVKPALYVIECMPNMIKPELITERTIPLVETIRKNNPDTPIIFVDLFKSPITLLNTKIKSENESMDNALKARI